MRILCTIWIVKDKILLYKALSSALISLLLITSLWLYSSSIDSQALTSSHMIEMKWRTCETTLSKDSRCLYEKRLHSKSTLSESWSFSIYKNIHEIWRMTRRDISSRSKCISIFFIWEFISNKYYSQVLHLFSKSYNQQSDRVYSEKDYLWIFKEWSVSILYDWSSLYVLRLR